MSNILEAKQVCMDPAAAVAVAVAETATTVAATAAAGLRWRRTRVKINSIMAFSPSLMENGSVAVHVVTPEFLRDLARRRDFKLLNQLRGIGGIAWGVGTDIGKGVQGDDAEFAGRRRLYGCNSYQMKPPRKLPVLLATLKDPIFIVLLLWGILALGFGIKHHGKAGLSDGVSICSAVFLVMGITTFSNLWPKMELFKLCKARDVFDILVLRNGQRQRISVFEAVVGDVVFLSTGDQVPADGLYIDGGGKCLQVDESLSLQPRGGNMDDSVVNIDSRHNPFLLCGTKVIDGSGRMLVTAVGINTEWGELLSSKSYVSDQSTPLQKRLHELSKLIGHIGMAVASLVLVVLLIRYFTGNLHDDDGKSHFIRGKTEFREVCDDVVGILATPVAIASTAIPEGLLLAVLISIAFSTKRITAQKALIRNLSACEAIGTTTVICTDERCKLTSNHLVVAAFCFGDVEHIVEKNKNPSSMINFPPKALELLSQAVFLSAAEPASRDNDDQVENAIREWVAFEQGRQQNHTNIHPPHETLNSEESTRSCSTLHVHQKGEAETILSICSHYYSDHQSGNIKDIPGSLKVKLTKMIQGMKSKGLRCIAFAHKDGSSDAKLDQEENCWILIGIVGLKYPCRPEVRKAVDDCKNARVDIKIVTRNDRMTATATAIECGILEANWEDTNTATGKVVEGQDFGTCAEDEKEEKCLGIRVMARASTLNKLSMVQCLKRKGEVVAVTGDTTGDARVLREADVGLSLGTQGTQHAKADSDVMIMEDNFDSVARVLTRGRVMRHKIQLFAQFQLTVSISSLVIDFVTAVSAKEPPTFKIVTAISSGKVPYATLQVLWVKLIVGTLAAVAITVEDPAELLIGWQLPILKRDQRFITKTMWKNIVGQALYPIITLLIIQFQGQSAFKLDSRVKDTMIFNIFVLWQILVILNTKGIGRNIFEGMRRRKLLWSIIGLIILLQAVIVELLHKFADTKPLTWKQWMVCVGIAVLAWPIGWVIEKIKCSSEALFQHPCDSECS